MIRKMFVMAWLLATLIGSAAAQDGLTPQTKQKFAKRNYFLALKKPYRAFGVLMKRSWKCHSGRILIFTRPARHRAAVLGVFLERRKPL